MRKVTLKPAGANDPVEIALSRCDAGDREIYEIETGDQHAEIELESTGSSGGWLRWQGRVIPFRACRRRGTLELWLMGRTYAFAPVEQGARRARADGRQGPASIELTAPMPGSILSINIAPGDAFEAHAPLVVMVSMKMEMALSAPHAGRVREVRCKAGQLVEMGAVLVSFEVKVDAGAP